MKHLWSIFTALLSFLQICIGDQACVIWSSAGDVVQRTSTFRVYCTFNLKCKYSMYSGHPPVAQDLQGYKNTTTIYLEVVNLTEDRTYSCDCDDRNSNTDTKPDSCGLDIAAGYPPDRPTNLSCVYKVADTHHSSAVVCSWASGRDTHLKNNSRLWVRTYTHNATGGSKPYSVSAKGRASLSAEFTVDSSVQVVSVWAHIENQLGSAESPVINYTLSDIMIPPAPILQQVECSSRNCTIKVDQSVPTHDLDINYKDDNNEWTPYPESVVAFGSVHVHSLEPYRPYHFRARSRFSTGLWSEWSKTKSNCTQEEAPATALDVWCAEDHNEQSMRVYWKKPDVSGARGKILNYIITVVSQNSTVAFTASSDEQSHSVPFCSKCVVTVCARNSRGLSPPASVTSRTTNAKPPLVPVINNQNVTIYWRKPVIAPLPVEYVVEWYQRGQKLHRLRWARMGGNSSHVVITDMTPSVCYEGAIYVFYKDSSVDRHVFTGISTATSVPTAGPSVQERVEGNTVNVTWSELPVSQRKGCITMYTIYLESSLGSVTSYNVSSSQKFKILRDLDPATYSIWMTASTAEGEGRPGQKMKFYIESDTQLPLLLGCGVLVVILLFFLCACHSSAVKQRFWVYLQCLMLDVIPDPANSKWAKECLQEKGKMSLQLQLSTSTVTEEEEDLVLVDIQELPRPLLCPQTSLNSDSETLSPLYPPTTYIKSFSHDSDSSYNTHTSLDTNVTVDYISSHGTTAMFEEETENSEDISCFFPSHSIFMEPLDLGPKLTLDAVRIDGNEFFIQCN